MGTERRRKGKRARTGISAACCSDGACRVPVTPGFPFPWEVRAEWACFLTGLVFFAWEAEVSSLEWEFIDMSEQEEDLIYRMYKLVGDRYTRVVSSAFRLGWVVFLALGMIFVCLETRWALIAGRIPGRKAEEIERFWIMRHGEVFADRRRHHQKLLLWRERSPGY